MSCTKIPKKGDEALSHMGEIGGQGQLAEKYESISSRSESLIIIKVSYQNK